MKALLLFAFAARAAEGLNFAGLAFAPAEEASIGDANQGAAVKGRALAEQLREARAFFLKPPAVCAAQPNVFILKVLPVGAETSKQLEPAVDQPRENEKEKEARGELLVFISSRSRLLS